MTAAALAGGFAVLEADDVASQIEDHYLSRLGSLPDGTQRLMLVAAADPVGDAALVWRAAHTLGIGRTAAAPAATEQLLEIGARVRFRHPLVRSAVYRSSSGEARRAAHAALATATDAETDPDRRAWHRAQSTSGLDEEIATELERSADRALARGGLAAAAAFLSRAAELTPDPDRRTERMLAAAQSHLYAGAFEAALGLLAAVESAGLDDFGRGRVELIQGLVASGASSGKASVELLQTAKRLEALDVGLARETYLGAWGAALFAGRLADASGTLLEVSRAARAAPRPRDRPAPTDLLLDGLAAVVTDGRVAAAPMLGRAVHVFRDGDVSVEQWLQWGILASAAAVSLWDFDCWDALSTRQIEAARAAGALTPLSIALNGQAMIATWSGRLELAASLGAEDEALKEATGIAMAPYGSLLLAAYEGRAAEFSALADATMKGSAARGEGLGITLTYWTTAIVENALGHYERGLAAAEQASDETPGFFISAWALVELIEAAARCGEADRAAEALRRLAAATDIGDSDWAAGIEARSRALLDEGGSAENLYVEAIERLDRTRLRPELARAHLLYGEWLRREGKRGHAREQLRQAHEIFAAMGAEGFADRARRELLATGETVRKRRDDSRNDLTSQEDHIARLARDGRTNPEIGAELYISARTVEWHLRKVFTKLGITSRRELQEALPSRDRAGRAP
jgi:DNA-binding CsgD family transcriptional regulator